MSIPARKLSQTSAKIVEGAVIDASGRFVLPASIRKAANFRPGQRFTISLFGEIPNQVIEIRSIESAIAQAQAIARRMRKGKTGSVVDEFIAERRAEALRED